jgi:hypothetical protein
MSEWIPLTVSKFIPITVYIVRANSKVECLKVWRPPVLTCDVEVAHQLRLHGLKSSDFTASFVKTDGVMGAGEALDGALEVGQLDGRVIRVMETSCVKAEQTEWPKTESPLELNGRGRKRAAGAAAEDAGGFCKQTIPDGRAEDVTDRALLRSRHQERLRREYEDRTREVDAIHEKCKDVAVREAKARLKAEESVLEAERLKDQDADYVSETGKWTNSTSEFYQEISECYSLISQKLAKELAELEEERGRAMRRKTDALVDAASARTMIEF